MSGGVRNVWIHDCTFDGFGGSLLQIKTNERRGGFVENIQMERMEARGLLLGAVLEISTDAMFQWRAFPTHEVRVSEISGIRLKAINFEMQHGILASVYDDCIVYSRRDFRNDLPIGDDWVQSLPAAESRPFAFASRAATSVAPQFPAGAKLAISRVRAKTRGGTEKDAVELAIPAANAKPRGRALYYDVVAGGDGGKMRRKRVLVSGYSVSERAPVAKKGMTCRFAIDELPAPSASFTVAPVNCFGKRGEPLRISWG